MRFRKKKHTWISLEERGDDDGASYSDRIDLRSAIAVLPNGYKTAFVLHDIQGYDHREIAKMFGYSTGNSKSQLHKARLRLRSLLYSVPQKGCSKT